MGRLADASASADLDAAAAFVTSYGNDVDRARLAALQGGRAPDTSIIDLAGREQAIDGGFPAAWSGGQSSLDATCHHLSSLADLGRGAGAIIDRAVGFLAGQQRSDGSFEEAVSTVDMPPWARPGDIAARLYLTANCGYWLWWHGRAHDGRRGAVRAATAWLAARIGADGRLSSYLHTHWLAIPLLRDAGFDQAADGLHWALAFRLNGLGPTALTWLIATIPDEPVAVEARVRLARLQEYDGRWASEDGPAEDVSTTLAAIRALRAR